MKEEGGRMKEEGGRMKEEGGRRKNEEGVSHASKGCRWLQDYNTHYNTAHVSNIAQHSTAPLSLSLSLSLSLTLSSVATKTRGGGEGKGGERLPLASSRSERYSGQSYCDCSCLPAISYLERKKDTLTYVSTR